MTTYIVRMHDPQNDGAEKDMLRTSKGWYQGTAYTRGFATRRYAESIAKNCKLNFPHNVITVEEYKPKQG